MKRIFLIICLAAIIGGLGLAFAGPPDKGSIYRISLDDDIINPVSAEYITMSIEKAEAEGATCLIIELDTPGGLLSSTRGIVKRIMNAKVPVVVYVAPKGARAGSAGVFITLAANIAAMAPSTNIGAAHPVMMSDKRDSSDIIKELLKRFGNKDEEKDEKKKKEKKKAAVPMDQKILNDTKAWVAGIAKDRGRNVKWALKAVEESVSVTDSEALKLGVIDIVAKDFDELIAKLDGRTVTTTAGKVTLKTAGAKTIEIPKNFRLRWLAVLAHPNIAYILMMLGFYGLLFEFTHPGIGFPGIAGAICLILAFFGLQVLPTNYAGVALIVLAIILFIAEIKVTSYGLLTLGGVVTLFLGSLILFSSPYDFMRVSIPIAASFTAATLVIALFLIYIVMRLRKRKVATGIEGMIGTMGDVTIWNDHDGKVMVHGEIWNAHGDESFSRGDKIAVTKVDGMTLFVARR